MEKWHKQEKKRCKKQVPLAFVYPYQLLNVMMKRNVVLTRTVGVVS